MTEIQSKLVEEAKETPGKTAGLAQQMAQFDETLATARTHWQSGQQLTDLQISVLTTQQAGLSRRALKGSPSLVGTLVNTVALKAALSN